MTDVATSLVTLTTDMGGWEFARRQRHLQRFADRLRWVLEDAGCTEGRAYYGEPGIERPGFRITPITPDPLGNSVMPEQIADHCEVSHFTSIGADTRPLVARYHAAIEAAGFRCVWDHVFETRGGYYARFRVYPPADEHKA